MESGVASVAQAVEAPVSTNKETVTFGMPPTTNLDAFGPSFSEMLKSTKKPALQYDASESADGGLMLKSTRKLALQYDTSESADGGLMLKSAKKLALQYDTSESADGGLGGKGAKKKAKKGKQIDPSLLGFKVHSNRILMGEIHRLDD